jgi:hypothetical protein
MASTKEYLEYILDQLSELEEITYRAMMGEYILLPACFLNQTIPHRPIASQSLKMKIFYKPSASCRGTMDPSEENAGERKIGEG